MTDTPVFGESTEAEVVPELVESETLGSEAPAEDTPLKTRALLPFFVPLIAIAIVAVLVLNISRVFLAGDKNTALVWGIIITLSILVGASLLAAAPHLKTSSLALILCGIFVVVSIAGFVSLGPSLKSGEASAGAALVNPPGAATSTVSVSAGPGLSFNGVKFTGTYTAKAGIVRDRLRRRQRPHPRHPGPQVRRVPPLVRGHTQVGQGQAGSGELHDLLHRPRSRGLGDEGHHHRLKVSIPRAQRLLSGVVWRLSAKSWLGARVASGGL